MVQSDVPFTPLRSLTIEAGGVGDPAAEALRGRGHAVELVEPQTPLMGCAQMIRRLPDGTYEGGADPRVDSVVAGI